MKRLLTAAALLALVMAGVAHAAEINTSALSLNGWYSDDTRADGTGTQSAGTNLISPTLTDDPEATALGNPAHDADILNQILFGLPPVAPPVGTHPAAVHLRIAAGVVPGKSQISHRNTTTGFAAGTAFTDPGFFVDYKWMGDGSGVVTAAVKIGIQTSDFGSTGSSSRTGENAWDKILIYEPSNGNGGSADGAWHSESVDYNNGKWWFFDRTVLASNQSNPMTLADMATSTLAFSGAKTVQDVYNLSLIHI